MSEYVDLYRFAFRAMGSPCVLTLHASSHEQADAVKCAVQQDVALLEQRYSRYQPDSLLSRLNRQAHRAGGFRVDDEMAGLLDYAQTCWEQSDGLFDITSGILWQAWNFSSHVRVPGAAGGGRTVELPNPKTIARLMRRVGWARLSWQRPVLHFRVEGMALDFGGIAKEYAADRAATVCLAMGVQAGMINFGGDLRIIGPHPDGKPWDVGIAHPREADQLLATLSVPRGAVTTSGDYERCLVLNGKYYSHLLNPFTGWPVDGLSSVSVVAPHALIAGSASTIAMLKGNSGVAWLENLGLPALWVDATGATGSCAAGA